MKAIICDIDQCLLDSLEPIALKNRALHLGTLTNEEAWDRYYNNLDLCKRNEWCFTIINQMTLIPNLMVLFITGREEKCRKATEKFFKFAHKINYKLLMRPTCSLDADWEVKEQILKDIAEDYDILFAIDDREDNCEVYRKFGITTLKATSMELH